MHVTFPTFVLAFLAVTTSLTQIRQDLSKLVDDDVVVRQSRRRLQIVTKSTK